MNSVISVKNLVKKFGEFTAVDNLSFDIEQGKIYGFLGINGAGKSTTINMICGLLNATEGEIKVFSESVHDRNSKVKKEIGLVPQNIAVYMNYTVEENVKFFGSLYDMKRKELETQVQRVIELVGLEKQRKKLACELSGGMKRRLNIACSLVHNPKLLILDEPTLGIDPKSRRQILNTVKLLNEQGTTVMYTTHYLDEVEELCHEVIIIHSGKMLVKGTMDKLKELVSDVKTLQIEVENICDVSVDSIKKLQGVRDVSVRENSIIIDSAREVNNLDNIILYFTNNHIKITDINYKDIKLEDVFLKLTGEKLLEGRAVSME